VSTTAGHDARCAALDGFLEDRQAQGYSIETRSALQAVIVRDRRRDSVLALFGRGRAERRLVVSVDEDAIVTSIAAEPRRW
jgi:hypothetical protein